MAVHTVRSSTLPGLGVHSNMRTNIRGKTLTELSLEELAYLHLDDFDHPWELKDGLIRSALPGLIAEVRKTRTNDRTRIFSPLYGCFALLDQIGSVYQNLELPACANENASGIKKALYYFCGFPEDSDDVKAIYGLRNALMHDGSMLYRGRWQDGKWKGPFHYFRLGSESELVVEMPQQSWNGKLEDLRMNVHATLINQSLLADVALNAVSVARGLLQDGKLKIRLGEGPIELYYKYLFHTRKSEDTLSSDTGA